jgi:hypothetical protein
MNNSSPVRTAMTKKGLTLSKDITEQKKKPKLKEEKGDHV